ncbi:Ctr copper transporter-like protein [Lindgomyces ingoldianus]|uniref:Ctr copper transporter-like protein n=1 Tax=Lindgomyces ingoldianus TaxID=673940 RepID=A0ACB6QG52_9PLEO|nr:Ctr copper transporter-like protein [Lindgomyces ingoldianus]KAF2465901.1 Ctr copper transporter-like protein [Lindgomyces ingoldianus]
MSMGFFSATNTPLYSTSWTPSSAGAYAGTCIFLIILAILYRGGFTLKHHLDLKWAESSLKRRYVVVADKTPVAEQVASDTNSTTGILTTNGVEERVRVVQAPASHIQPWRFSVDLPRAAVMTVIAGVGYLLMLAVMTFNVGYFISVLGGTLIGELIFGRFNQEVMRM